MSDNKKIEKKTFDNIVSRSRLTKARDEVARIRRRVTRLDAALVDELSDRIRGLDAAVIHGREALDTLRNVRTLRGRG